MICREYFFACILLLAACSFTAKSADNKSVDEYRLNKKISNNLGIKFVYITPGTFLMGRPSDEPGRTDDEKLHRVTLTKGFYMQTTEVTQGQWKAVMKNYPPYLRMCGDDCPVERISWNDTQTFIHKLNELTGSGNYRLPTEAEWEYAARSGSTTAFANGGISVLDCSHDLLLDEIGWYCGNSASYPHHPVAQKKPNAWGLYDMHGSIWEWCRDWHANYPSGSITNPIGPSIGTEKVLRGGGLADATRSCRSANRFSLETDIRYDYIGFRLVRIP